MGTRGQALQRSSLAHRTDALLLRLSLVVGREVFYAALWGSVLASPSIRLPASLFVVSHINRDLPGKEQKYMLGTDHQLTVGALLLRGACGQVLACSLCLRLPRDIRQREGRRACQGSGSVRSARRGAVLWRCALQDCWDSLF